jgi:hypothetical protein
MNHLEALRHLLTLLPLQVVAGGAVPVIQFAQQRLLMRQAAQRKQDLRTRLVALHAFISSIEGIPAEHEARAVCLEDALLEQEHALKELASAILHRAARRKRIRPHNWLQWFFMLYPPPRHVGWILRWSFFALMIVTVVGTARGLLHENYLPTPVLVPFVITSFVLAVVVRATAFHIERVRPSHRS